MTTAAKRSSRPLQRKTSHSVIERRRRDKINQGLVHLQNIVPACRQELRELLECKVSKASKRDECQLQEEVDRMLHEKASSQILLEKLCIISHTVEYVEALEAKIDAYRSLYPCSPSLPEPATYRSDHRLSHSAEEDTGGQCSLPPSPASDYHEAMSCSTCATASQGKRHWESNRPLRLNKAAIKGQQTDDKQKKRKDMATNTQVSKRRRRLASESVPQRTPPNDDDDSDDTFSDVEVDHWHANNISPIYASHLYTNHDNREEHRNAPLGLLAQVSAEARNVETMQRLY